MEFPRRIIWLLTACLSCSIGSFSQENANPYLEETNRVFQSLNTNEAFSMKIEYVEIDAAGKSEVVSTCHYFKKGEFGGSVFEDNESMMNSDFFVKVDHPKKEMIVINKNGDKKSELNSDDAIQQFDPDYFNENGYKIDSVLSRLNEGVLIFNSTENPYYKRIEIHFDAQSYLPVSYTLYLHQVTEGLKAFQIRLKNIHFGEFDKSLLDEGRFFSTKAGRIVPTEKYKNYQVITL